MHSHFKLWQKTTSDFGEEEGCACAFACTHIRYITRTEIEIQVIKTMRI
jgi:hypothetical protein